MQDGKPSKYIPDLADKEVKKGTSRKKADVKDVVAALLGSPSLMSQIYMTMLEHEELLKNFALLSKMQVEIYSSQDMGNVADFVGFGQNPTLGKSSDYEAPEDRNPALPSINSRRTKE